MMQISMRSYRLIMVMAKRNFLLRYLWEHGIIEYIADLLKIYGVKDEDNKNCMLQNGKRILGDFFLLRII